MLWKFIIMVKIVDLIHLQFSLNIPIKIIKNYHLFITSIHYL